MKEYIERALAVQELEVLRQEYEMHDDCDELVARRCRDAISALPAADVVEVRHGRWEPGNPICPVCGENKFKDLDADVWADWQPKFCPNCGARMGKEDGHD